MDMGYSSETGKIVRLLLKHPREAFIRQSRIDAQWEKLHYTAPPDLHRALEEYEAFAALLRREISDLHFLPQDPHTNLDSLYVRDAVIMTPRGAILCNMGKPERKNEPAAAGQFLETIGIPVLGSIRDGGTVEGGDVLLLDERTLAVGHGYRTNGAGIAQLQALTESFIEEFIVVPLPHWNGPDDVLHLMSFISPLDQDLAVVYPRLMPVPFRERLLDRGMKMIEVPDSEYDGMACNILAVAPRKCLMLKGNPLTKDLLQDEGVEILEYDGEEISKKGAGGPTCLTRPLARE